MRDDLSDDRRDDTARGHEAADDSAGEETMPMRPEPDASPADETTAPGTAEVTSVAPPGEPPTRALPGEAATRVLPSSPGAAGLQSPGGTPPPLGAAPPGGAPPGGARFRATTPPGRDGAGRPPRWLWFALAGVAAGLALAAVFALLTRGPDVEPFLGTWGPTAAGGSPLGGLVIEDQGGETVVTVYSAAVEEVGTVAAAWEGDELVATLADAEPLVGAGGPATLRMVHDDETDHLVVTIVSGAGTAVQRLARLSSLAPGPAHTSPAPTAAPTAAPTPTATPTASPDASPSPTASADVQVRAGITAIQVGVLTWAADHGGLFPPASEVSAEGEVGALVDPWPTSPFTGGVMQSGSAAGDYTYEQLDAGQAYRLTGYLSDGSTVVVP